MFLQTYPLEQYPTIVSGLADNVEAPAMTRFEMGFDMSMSRENPTIAAYDFAKFQLADDELIDKETWEYEYARPDTKWEEGMTRYQAKVIRDDYDYNLQYNRYQEMDGFNAANIGGYFAGALFDPLNYLPWTRAMSASLNIASRGALKLGKLGRSSEDVVNAMLGSVVGEGAIASRKYVHQSEYDVVNAIVNVAMAGTIGAGVAGMRKVQDKLSKQSIEQNIGSAGKALDDGANGQSPEIDGSNPPKDKLEIEIERESPVEEFADKVKNTMDREIDLLNQNPTIKAGLDAAREKADSFVNFLTCKYR